MLAPLAAGSPPTIALLALCFFLVLAFEFSNGFHDTANAVATVIYTHSLKPLQAVIWSGLWNFIGVVTGGIAVAYALVEILPPEVLSPPDGGTASGMLIALFVTALGWNVLTWFFGIPNSSSHALIGALVGIAIGSSIKHRQLGQGVEWKAILDVLEGLLASPILGFLLSLLLFQFAKRLLHDKNLFKPPKNEQPPVMWMRALLVLTCTGVSFAHGTNDGQKSIGLIMLTIIGLMPVQFALNQDASQAELARLRQGLPTAAHFIERYGDDQKLLGVQASHAIDRALDSSPSIEKITGPQRIAVRADAYRVLAELETIGNDRKVPKPDAADAKRIHKEVGTLVTFAPWWVRILSAIALGLGTMIGYKRIVQTWRAAWQPASCSGTRCGGGDSRRWPDRGCRCHWLSGLDHARCYVRHRRNDGGSQGRLAERRHLANRCRLGADASGDHRSSGRPFLLAGLMPVRSEQKARQKGGEPAGLVRRGLPAGPEGTLIRRMLRR